MNSVGKTDVGVKRFVNQDSIFVSDDFYGPFPNLYIVADGMGGHKAGEYASRFALQVFCEFVKEYKEGQLKTKEELLLFLKRAVIHTNWKVFQQSRTNICYQGMGTTFTVATILGENVYIAHVGDSRAYVIGDKETIQITTDHSLIEQMVKQGDLSKEEAMHHPKRNIITRAVGTYDKLKVDTICYPIKQKQKILLCSDGLTTMVREEEILEITQTQGLLDQKVGKLIQLAKQRGGLDNISVILCEREVELC